LESSFSHEIVDKKSIRNFFASLKILELENVGQNKVISQEKIWEKLLLFFQRVKTINIREQLS